MTSPFSGTNLSEKNRPERIDSPNSEANFSQVSIDSDISSFPEVSILSSSSFQSRKPFYNPSPRPPRPFKRPYHPPPKRHNFYRAPGFRFNQPVTYPLPYFGQWRGEHSIPHAKPKLETSNFSDFFKSSFASASVPPLVTNPVTSHDESPGPSWMTPDDSKPIIKNPHKKRKMMIGDCFKKSGIQTAIRQASPNCKLTEQQGRFIQSQLIEALDNTPKQISPPRFLKSFYDQGVFWMVCADEKTKQWLIQNVKQLTELWDDLNLIVETVKFPKRPIVYVDLPELQKTVEILDRLESQNKDLRTKSWVILNQQIFKSRQRVTFSIDMDSFEFLKARNFTATWKLQTVIFKVPSKGIKSRSGKWMKGKAGPH